MSDGYVSQPRPGCMLCGAPRALRAQLAAATTERDRLQRALMRYGCCDDDCGSFADAAKCTCGLDEAIAARALAGTGDAK